jgi:hypothetical protein
MADFEEINYLRDQLNSANAKMATMTDQFRPALDRVKAFKANAGLKEDSDGRITVDFEKFARNLGLAGALQLRAVIDEVYKVSGEAGEKPRVKLGAA